MEYNKLRNKVKKFYGGGLIFSDPDLQSEYEALINNGYAPEQAKSQILRDSKLDQFQFGQNATFNDAIQSGYSVETASKLADNQDLANQYVTSNKITTDSTGKTLNQTKENVTTTVQEIQNSNNSKSLLLIGGEGIGAIAGNTINTIENAEQLKESGLLGGAIGGIAAQVGVGAMKAIDNLAMGDKNFGAQSQAIDSTVHGISGALMSSGNPYAMAAGAALEGANFLTKAGGQTVQGFDVNIENSGFGTVGHMESSSSRDFGAMIGLGGLFTGGIDKKLARRNLQARMAMLAAEISEDIKFEQEARMNSVDNVLRNNLIALAGGIDTSLLGS